MSIRENNAIQFSFYYHYYYYGFIKIYCKIVRLTRFKISIDFCGVKIIAIRTMALSVNPQIVTYRVLVAAISCVLFFVSFAV